MRGAPLRILALEPYYGGSHRAVLDGLVKHVEADWTLLTLPARKWKWRMRGSAMNFAAEVRARTAGSRPGEERAFDLIFASTFVNLAEFLGLAGDAVAGVPAIVYFHENQLVYPNRHEAEWDFQFPLTNITSALSADRCLFNTAWNRDRFIEGIAPFLRQFPDHHPTGVAEAVAARSSVLAPPFDSAAFDAADVRRGERCRIVWPHRWEHDKQPELFLDAVSSLAREGLDFEVVLAGQPFKETVEPIRRAASALGDRLVHIGDPGSRSAYADLLSSCDIAVSTARNEFFGIAMIEACRAGCFPVVPDALSYPELYDAEYRYAGLAALVARLRSLVLERPSPGTMRDAADAFTFEALAPRYADLFREVAASACS